MSIEIRGGELQKVQIGGQANEYLCNIDTETGDLKDALLVKGQVSCSDFPQYISQYLVGKLEDIKTHGQPGYISRSLTKDELIVWEKYLAQANEALIYANMYWAKEVFHKIVYGKYSFQDK